MANYSNVKGFTVQTLSTDTVASQGAGGSWASGGDMNTARIASTGTSASSTNSIIGGGYYLPPTVNRSVTESYDGSTWSELSDHPVSIVYGNGLGVKTAALIAGIDVSAAPTNSQTYIFDGSSWSAPGASINTFKFFSATGGTTTAGIIAGGNTPPATGTTETWNGSSWTETTDLNTAKTNLGGGTGTSTALMAVGGIPTTIEVYDGSSWTEIAELNTARYYTSKGGITTSAIVSGGVSTPAPSNYPAQTELYNGTSWTEVGDTPVGIAYACNLSSGQPGGQADSIIAGGQTATGFSATTLEWSAPATFTKQVEGQLFFNSTTNTFKETITDFPAATWASGGSLNTARDGMFGGAGTQTAGQVTGGRSAPGGNLAVNELYDGTSFTESADLNTARQFLTTFGATNTASITTGGAAPSASATTESWDGSSFTEVNDLNSARSNLNSAGTKTAGLVFGGSDTANRAYSESWDGTNWTEVSDLNTARGGHGGCGLQTAAIAFGGYSTTVVNNTETWDGTSWTEVNNLNTAREKPAGSGTQSAALSTGGDPPASATNEFWNGTSWTEINDLSTARGASGTSHNSASATFVAGGRNASGNQVTTTEEFTAGLANKTITAS